MEILELLSRSGDTAGLVIMFFMYEVWKSIKQMNVGIDFLVQAEKDKTNTIKKGAVNA